MGRGHTDGLAIGTHTAQDKPYKTKALMDRGHGSIERLLSMCKSLRFMTWVQWCMPIVPGLGSQTQEAQKFKDILGYIANSRLA